ncbi:PREDICTED: uncharacterized protein LOC109148684 [Ipomoea nil]|uniref:uncharacterized protein LOC109148684 n=1 Tax=Ipomoea nil TaxID=35883 RepID=UPI000900E8B1|nr:PREDICTED: uncharacterized protein LOC109148684 [Ipomoea nil]
MGDYNDILEQSEKVGVNQHPNWLIAGFKEAVADSGLQDIPFSGHQFSWEKSRGTAHMVEEKLDRILATGNWLNMFDGARAQSFIVPYSDHLPLVITPSIQPRVQKKAMFCFDIVGQDILSRVEACAADISKWGRGYNREFQPKTEYGLLRLERLRSRRDMP